MATPTTTYTFTNGITSDAGQVNTNFTNIIAALTDTTADLSFATLILSGSATLNGGVTLGNSSADNITFTGSVSSNIPYGTNASFQIGSATLAPQSIYLGNSTFTTRLLSAATSAWTFTLPATVATVTGQTMIFTESGVASFRYVDKFTASKTSTYAATGDETIIPCAPASSMSVSLPAASTMTGKKLTIIKTDTDITKTVTIDPNASETINGAANYILYTQYESLTIACNGTSWFILDHFATTPMSSNEVTTIAAVSVNPTKGTTQQFDAISWYRDGAYATVHLHYEQSSGAGGAAGTGAYLITLPGGLIAHSTEVTPSTDVDVDFPTKARLDGGIVLSNATTTSENAMSVQLYSTTQISLKGKFGGADAIWGSATMPLNSIVLASGWFRFRVAGWNS